MSNKGVEEAYAGFVTWDALPSHLFQGLQTYDARTIRYFAKFAEYRLLGVKYLTLSL